MPQATSTATKPRDKKWELTAAQTNEWKAWVEEQKQAAGLKEDVEDIYVQVHLSKSAYLAGSVAQDVNAEQSVDALLSPSK